MILRGKVMVHVVRLSLISLPEEGEGLLALPGRNVQERE